MSVLLSQQSNLSITPKKWCTVPVWKHKKQIFMSKLKHSPDYMGSRRWVCLLFLSVLALDYLKDSFGLYSHFTWLHYPPCTLNKLWTTQYEWWRREQDHQWWRYQRGLWIIKVYTSNWSSNSWGPSNSCGSLHSWDHWIVGDHRVPLDLSFEMIILKKTCNHPGNI